MVYFPKDSHCKFCTEIHLFFPLLAKDFWRLRWQTGSSLAGSAKIPQITRPTGWYPPAFWTIQVSYTNRFCPPKRSFVQKYPKSSIYTKPSTDLYLHLEFAHHNMYSKITELQQQIQQHCMYSHNKELLQIDTVQLNAPKYDPAVGALQYQ